MNEKEIKGNILGVLTAICTVAWLPVAHKYGLVGFVGAFLQFFCYFSIGLFSVERFKKAEKDEEWWVRCIRKLVEIFVMLSNRFLWKIINYLSLPLIVAAHVLLKQEQKLIALLIIGFMFTCTGGSVILYKEEKNGQQQ